MKNFSVPQKSNCMWSKGLLKLLNDTKLILDERPVYEELFCDLIPEKA